MLQNKVGILELDLCTLIWAEDFTTNGNKADT